MITLHDLEEAIKECEGKRNPTSSDCVKLAAYLTIRNEMQKAESTTKAFNFGDITAQIDARNSDFDNYSTQSSAGTPTIDIKSGTEFAELLKHSDAEKILNEVDELLTALSALQPRMYRTFIARIKTE